jgi:hypothetical protein
MKVFARFLLPVLLLMAFSAGAHAQERGEFIDAPNGFKVSLATEKDGSHVLLVLYPEKYLVESEFDKGSLDGLVSVLGCDYFKDCKPVLIEDKTKTGLKYSFALTTLKVEGKNVRVVLWRLRGESRIVGAVFSLAFEPETVSGTLKT